MNEKLNIIDVNTIEAEMLFYKSFSYILFKFGTELQDNLLVDMLAEQVATNYFEHAKEQSILDVSVLDPLVGDTSCQIRATVLANTNILG